MSTRLRRCARGVSECSRDVGEAVAQVDHHYPILGALTFAIAYHCVLHS
jgi:hypothetical protein